MYLILLYGLVLTGAEPVRTWKDVKGRKMEASFVEFAGEKIVIKRKDGRTFTLSPSFFSSEDQRYLADLKSYEGFLDGATIVAFVKGQVRVLDPSEKSFKESSSEAYSTGKPKFGKQIGKGDVLPHGWQIKVGADSEATLLFSNGVLCTIGSNSLLSSRKFKQEGFLQSPKKVSNLKKEISPFILHLDLEVGDIVVDVRTLEKKSNFEIKTPLGVAGIRGTSFRLLISEQSTKLTVLTGRVDFDSREGNTKQVGSQKVLAVTTGKDPILRDLTKPERTTIEEIIAKARVQVADVTLLFLRKNMREEIKIHLVPSAGNMEMIWVKPLGPGARGGILANGFYLGKHEVTQAQYQLVRTNISANRKNPSFHSGNPEFPVEMVSYPDAKAFLARLNLLEQKAGRLPKGWEYDLPTEAEWKYACKAGTKTLFWWGNEFDPKNANLKESGNSGPLKVGRYPPNPWGFHDMFGNVFEFTLEGTIEGGSWLSSGILDDPRLDYQFLSFRSRQADRNVGFRIALKKVSNPR